MIDEITLWTENHTLQVKYSEMEKTIELTEKQLKETIEAVQAEKKLQQAEEG